ncbi:MAG: restriction endonuclease subunit S [Nitrospirota bacterium]
MKLTSNLKVRGWRKDALGRYIQLSNGKGITAKQMGPDKLIPVYGSSSIIGYADEPLIFSDTIVIGRVGACGSVQVAKAPCWVSDNAMYVSNLRREIDFEFLFYLLDYLQLGRLASRTMQPSLPQGPILEHEFLLPPLPVQERIVQILQKADEIRRKRREALELADKILPAIYKEAFGDPIGQNSTFPKARLGDCADIRRGISKRPTPKGTVPIVRIKNLTLSGLDLSCFERVEANEQEVARAQLAEGDIVFSPLNGSIHHLAKSDVFHAPVGGNIWVLDSNLCAFRARPEIIRPTFLATWLSLPEVLGHLRTKLAVRTSGGQWLLKNTTLASIEIPLPSLSQQDYFVTQAQQLLQAKRGLARASSDSTAAFSSLLSRAFTGELTAEWEAANAEWIAAQQALHERVPRLVVLALLSEKVKRTTRTAAQVLVTALMKYAFLLQMEGNGGRRRIYHFVPYHYGPFAKELYTDLQSLQEEGLVRVDDDSEEDKTKITLVDRAKADEALAALPDDLQEDAATIIEIYGDLDHNALLKTVYEKYPAYAKKSRLRRGQGRQSPS